jgi:hypothetical protein
MPINDLKEKWDIRSGRPIIELKLKEWGVYRDIHNASTSKYERTKKTKLRLYGDEHYNNFDKIIETTKEKFGANNVYQSEYFKDLMWIKGSLYISDQDAYKEYNKKIANITKINSRSLVFNGECYYTGTIIYRNTREKKIHFNFPWYSTIDHKISRKFGFINNINPAIIGNIDNLCYCSRICNTIKNELNEEEFLQSDKFKRLMIYENTKGKLLREKLLSL